MASHRLGAVGHDRSGGASGSPGTERVGVIHTPRLPMTRPTRETWPSARSNARSRPRAVPTVRPVHHAGFKRDED